MQSRTREFPKPKPRPGGKSFPPRGKTKQNAKYIHGVTVIDRSLGTSLTQKGKEQELIPSLLVGEPKCRACYERGCKCGKPLFTTSIDVYWTKSSPYLGMGFPAVRKCEDIAMAECKRFGMSCVVLRSQHHNTAAEFTRTGKRTGRFIDSDWHITLNLGDAQDKLLLQGHCYLYMGKGIEVPQCKLAPGNRQIIEPHEMFEQLTLEELPVDTYWGMNGSCGWVLVDE